MRIISFIFTAFMALMELLGGSYFLHRYILKTRRSKKGWLDLFLGLTLTGMGLWWMLVLIW